ncbi:MAG: aminoglycoside phosphotransferase family protein [Puia sp.]|nr:aminoglycoside phosphotransferase family protein [Puia sp.]
MNVCVEVTVASVASLITSVNTEMVEEEEKKKKKEIVAAITKEDFARFDPVQPVLRITDLTVGYNQYVCLFETDSGKYVLKKTKKPQPDLVSEFCATTLVHKFADQVPVPTVLYLDPTLLVETYISGIPLTEFIPDFGSQFVSLGRFLRSIHSARTEGFGIMSTPGKGQFRTEYEQVAALTHCDHPEEFSNYKLLKQLELGKNVYDKYKKQLLDSSASRLLHGDLRADNVLVQGGKISAILDFGDSVAGAPELDLAWFYLNAKRAETWDWFMKGYADSAEGKEMSLKTKLYVVIHATWLIMADFMPEGSDRHIKFLSVLSELAASK